MFSDVELNRIESTISHLRDGLEKSQREANEVRERERRAIDRIQNDAERDLEIIARRQKDTEREIMRHEQDLKKRRDDLQREFDQTRSKR